MYPFKIFAKPLLLEDQQRLIDAFKTRLLAFSGLSKLYLIGSASRLEMTDASDLDFIAVFKSDLEMESAKKDFYCSPRPVDWPCDVLWYIEGDFNQRKNSGGICFVAAEDGVQLHQEIVNNSVEDLKSSIKS